MIDPGFKDYLLEAIARTGVHRYRYLCLEHPDEKVRQQYQSLVIDVATGVHDGQRFDPLDPPADCRCCGGNPMAI